MKSVLKNRLENYAKPIQKKLERHSKAITIQNFWGGLKSQTQPRQMKNGSFIPSLTLANLLKR